MSTAWHDPTVTQVYNCDWELDDQWRLIPLCVRLRKLRKLRQRGVDGEKVEPPSTIVIAGQRNGLASRTFEEASKFLELHLGAKGQKISDDEGVLAWPEYRLKLLDGADLRQTSKDDWLNGKITDPSERTLEAVRRFAHELGDGPFNYHGCTSAVFWSALPQEIKDRCNLSAMTNAFYITADGKLKASANGIFDLKSIHDMAESGTPFVHSQGSLFSYDAQTFNDMALWPEVLKTKVVDPSFYRRQVEESMRLSTKWMHQIEAHLVGKSGDGYLPAATRRLVDVLKERGQDLSWLSEDTRQKEEMVLGEKEKKATEGKYAWLKDALSGETYTKDKTTQTWNLRLRALESKIVNPLDNSLADYLMTFADCPEPENCFYLPCTIDLEGISKCREDLTSIRVNFEDPNALLAILGDEDRLERHFERDVKDAQERILELAQELGAEMHDVVDVSTAKQIMTWYALQKKTAEAIVGHLDGQSYDTERFDDSQLAELRERMERSILACDTGPMALHAKSFLSSADTKSHDVSSV